MKGVILGVALVAFMALSSVSAQGGQGDSRRPYLPRPTIRPPQPIRFKRDVYIQKLPYYPRPTTGPVIQRARRATLGGEVQTNPAGGNNAKVELSQGIGNEQHNIIGKAFAEGNTKGGPVTTGGTLAYNNNGFGAALTKERIAGDRDILTKSLSANLFHDDTHSLDGSVFKSTHSLDNGFGFDKKGVGLSYSHANGHGLELQHTKIPDFGSQLSARGKANLWTSDSGNTRLDLTGGSSKWTSGPYSGRSDWNTGLGLTSYFG